LEMMPPHVVFDGPVRHDSSRGDTALKQLLGPGPAPGQLGDPTMEDDPHEEILLA